MRRLSRNIRLSCLELTGPLEGVVPLCVLKEISVAHEITPRWDLDVSNPILLKDFMDHVTKTDHKRPEVRTPITEPRYLTLAAKFLNPHVDWSPEALNEAVDSFRIYATADVLPGTSFDVGLPTPSSPGSLPAVILYKICKSRDLSLSFYHTIHELAAAVKMLSQEAEGNRLMIKRVVSHIDNVELPNLYLRICTLPFDNDEDSEESDEGDFVVPELEYHEDVTQAVTTFGNSFEVLKRVHPSSTGEAVALAAMIYRTDISQSGNPIQEYVNMWQQRTYHQEWVPIDIEMRRTVTINPFSYSIDMYFNPLLPYELYNNDVLDQLAINEGYTLMDIRRESSYSLLSSAFLLPTFYHGTHSTVLNEETPIAFDSIIDIENDALVSFGIKSYGLTAFLYSELVAEFNHNRNFTNPVDGNPFPTLAISKLKRLCQRVLPLETTEGHNIRQELYQAITLAELFVDERNSALREFYVVYEDADNDTKDSIFFALERLLSLAMHCRGWLGEGPYPIERAPVDDQVAVDLKVTQAIADFENSCTVLGEIGTVIMGLPLFKFKNNIWQAHVGDSGGRTIGEKIITLKAGEDHSDMTSCMRLTSNFLSASVYRYFEILNFERPFDIYKLRDIS